MLIPTMNVDTDDAHNEREGEDEKECGRTMNGLLAATERLDSKFRLMSTTDFKARQVHFTPRG
jgi:hypothetical protein